MAKLAFVHENCDNAIVLTYLSSGSQSLKPFAKGLLAIFNWVICGLKLKLEI